MSTSPIKAVSLNLLVASLSSDRPLSAWPVSDRPVSARIRAPDPARSAYRRLLRPGYSPRSTGRSSWLPPLRALPKVAPAVVGVDNLLGAGNCLTSDLAEHAASHDRLEDRVRAPDFGSHDHELDDISSFEVGDQADRLWLETLKYQLNQTRYFMLPPSNLSRIAVFPAPDGTLLHQRTAELEPCRIVWSCPSSRPVRSCWRPSPSTRA